VTGPLERARTRQYNPSMRLPMRLALLVGFPLLAVIVILYSVFWFVAAGRIEQAVGDWAGSMREHNLDLVWRGMRVRGFPFAFRVEMSDARLHDQTTTFTGDVQTPMLSASASPWDFYAWQLAAPEGLTVDARAPSRPSVRITAKVATGAVLAGAADNGTTIWLAANDVTTAMATPLNISTKTAKFWLILPGHAPQGHTDPAMAVAVDASGVAPPAVPAPLHGIVDEFAFGLTVKGPISAATPPRRAAEVWRDAGGTIELDHLTLRWGNLGVRATGTLALDENLQPIGALSGGVAGYPELLRALVAAGRLRRNDADVADVALSFLARAGPDGRPEIATSLAIQEGQMLLGPVKLGPAPRIDW